MQNVSIQKASELPQVVKSAVEQLLGSFGDSLVMRKTSSAGMKMGAACGRLVDGVVVCEGR
jgi:hypothetical protein